MDSSIELCRSQTLGQYNSLMDRNLTAYFSTPPIRTQLERAGLVSASGRILSDSEYRRIWALREHKAHARKVINETLRSHSSEFQLGRQMEIQKQLDAVEKVEHYRRIKGIAVYDDGPSLGSNHIPPLPLSAQIRRRNSLGAVSTPASANRSTAHLNGLANQRPISAPMEGLDLARTRKEGPRYLDEVGRWQMLHKLDPVSLKLYRLNLVKELRQVQRFQKQLPSLDIARSWTGSDFAQLGLPNLPDRPIDSLYDYRSQSLHKLRNNQSENRDSSSASSLVRSRSLSPLKSANTINGRNLKLRRLYLLSGGKGGRKKRNAASVIRCHLQYLNAQKDDQNDQTKDEIVVSQQHSGGNSIGVYNNHLSNKETFHFQSFRQPGFPFSLTFFVNGKSVVRVSTCCEARYRAPKLLGGETGVFQWLGVEHATPCQKCQLQRGLEVPYTNYLPTFSTMVNGGHDVVSSKPPRPRRIKKKPPPLSEENGAGNEMITAAAVIAANNNDELVNGSTSHGESSPADAVEVEVHHETDAVQNGTAQDEEDSDVDFFDSSNSMTNGQDKQHIEQYHEATTQKLAESVVETRGNEVESSKASSDDVTLPPMTNDPESTTVSAPDPNIEGVADVRITQITSDEPELAVENDSGNEEETNTARSEKSDKSQSLGEELIAKIKEASRALLDDEYEQPEKQEQEEHDHEKGETSSTTSSESGHDKPESEANQNQSPNLWPDADTTEGREDKDNEERASSATSSSKSSATQSSKSTNPEQNTASENVEQSKNSDATDEQSAEDDNDSSSDTTLSESDAENNNDDNDKKSETSVSDTELQESLSSSKQQDAPIDTKHDMGELAHIPPPAIEVIQATPTSEATESQQLHASMNDRMSESGRSEMTAANRILEKFGQTGEHLIENNDILEEKEIVEEHQAKRVTFDVETNEEKAHDHEDNDEENHHDTLSDELKQVCQLEDVTICNTDMNTETMSAIGQKLAENTSIKSLTFRSANLTDEHLKILAASMSQNSSPISVFNFNMNTLTEKSVPHLEALMSGRPVDVLLLRDNQLENDGVTYLVNSITKLKRSQPDFTLSRIDLGENSIGYKGASAVGRLLISHDNMNSLGLSGNPQITHTGWQLVATGLKEAKNLKSLDLDYCKMGDESAETICSALKNADKLKKLDVEGNDLKEAGGFAIYNLIRACPQLVNVSSMAGNNIPAYLSDRIHSYLQQNKGPDNSVATTNAKPTNPTYLSV